MNQERVKIDKRVCENLCLEVCNNFVPVSSRAAHNEALLFDICREIYCYLEEDFVLVPATNSSHLETYKSNLQLLVWARRAEYFDVLEIVERHINLTLNSAYH